MDSVSVYLLEAARHCNAENLQASLVSGAELLKEAEPLCQLLVPLLKAIKLRASFVVEIAHLPSVNGRSLVVEDPGPLISFLSAAEELTLMPMSIAFPFL